MVCGVISNSGTLTVTNCTFNNNTAISSNSYGGAISNEGGTLTIVNSTFTGNTATYGGAIYNYGYNGDIGTVNVTNSIFTGNNATFYGGAIYNNGTLNTSDSAFTNNIAALGGAIYNSFGNGIVKVNFNWIVGNGPNNSEIHSDLILVDATHNWWGSIVIHQVTWQVMSITSLGWC